MRVILPWLPLILLLSACAPHSVRAPVGERGDRPLHTPQSHQVRQGETLYSVAFLYGFEVSQLARWNRLQPPYTIYKGQRLRLRPPPPKPARKPVSAPKPRPLPPPVSASRPKVQVIAPSQPKTAGRTAPAAKPVPAAPAPAQTHAMPPSEHLSWAWPATGPLLSRFNARTEGRKGIDIGGRSGQPVRAAAAGKVVYSGSGLSGYGRLIIIKHNKEFLSAYAHNRKLIASEGQWVGKGQEIALMGNSGTDRVRLHFEIRKLGKPVDPLQYLPKR